MITTQTNKQRRKQINKQSKKQITDRLCNKQTCICIVLIQGNAKRLMKYTAVPAKHWKRRNVCQKVYSA